MRKSACKFSESYFRNEFHINILSFLPALVVNIYGIGRASKCSSDETMFEYRNFKNDRWKKGKQRQAEFI